MDALDREVKAEIDAEYRAQHGRLPDAQAYWLRYFAHPKILANTASTLYDLAVAKVQWEQMQAEEKKNK